MNARDSMTAVVYCRDFPAICAPLRDAVAECVPHCRVVEVVDRDSLLTALKEAAVLVPTNARVGRDVIGIAHCLQLIQQWGAGTSGIDTAFARERHIDVANVPSKEGNADAVVEWILGALIYLVRRIDEARSYASEAKGWGTPVTPTLVKKRVAILGLGTIGTRLAEVLHLLGATPVGVTRRPAVHPSEFMEVRPFEELDAALRECAACVVAVPLTEETRGLLTIDRLSRLARRSVVVNAGRGGIIDEIALLHLVDTGVIYGAAIDVFKEEPLPGDSPLLGHSRIIATPHNAGCTELAYRRIGNIIAENINRVSMGTSPINVVN